jgi:hypothetical protein
VYYINNSGWKTSTLKALHLLNSWEISKAGQLICTVKYADEFVLMGMEEMVLEGMREGLIGIGRCFGMEMNVGKT